MDLGRAASEVGEVLPRLVDRTQAQARFVRALLARLGCTAHSPNGSSDTDTASESRDVDSPEQDISATPEESGTALSSAGEGTARRTDSASVEVSESPTAGALAIPSYESLAAAQVVPRLGSLSEPELRDVKAFESENRHRRTILNRIDQLLSDQQ